MPRRNGKQIQPWAKPRYTDAKFVEEQALCWGLKLRGMSIRDIAAHTGIPKSTVELRLRCEAAEIVEPLKDEWRKLELARLDAAHMAVVAALEGQHLVISDGHVVRMDGEPILDWGPVLAAVDRMVRISESRRKLLGLDEPVRHQVTHTEADVDAAVRELADEVERRARGRAVPAE